MRPALLIPCAFTSGVALLAVLLAPAVLALTVASAGDAVPEAVAPEALAATKRGAAALRRRAWADSRAAFEEALALASEDESQQRPARRNLALALSRQAEQALTRQDGGAALDLLDRALDLHPGRLRYEWLRGRALYHAGRHGDALRVAEDLSERSPAFAAAWILLADVHERAGELDAAVEALGRAQLLRPDDRALEQRIARVALRAQSEAQFLTHGSGHFQVRYAQDADPDTVRLALTLLEDAYARVTADLGLTPETAAQVILYEGGEFQRVTGAHSWVGALYGNGTLRVPTHNLERRRSIAARVLAHEFTHHVLRERLPSLPTWWHEGIAQFVEDTPADSKARRASLAIRLARQQEHSRLLTLKEMRTLKIASVSNTATVRLFYMQALGFVGWLVERYGSGALPDFFTALGARTDVDEAAKQAFGFPVQDLWKKWVESLGT